MLVCRIPEKNFEGEWVNRKEEGSDWKEEGRRRKEGGGGRKEGGREIGNFHFLNKKERQTCSATSGCFDESSLTKAGIPCLSIMV